jgi:hypothetical protein
MEQEFIQRIKDKLEKYQAIRKYQVDNYKQSFIPAHKVVGKIEVLKEILKEILKESEV